MPCYTPPPKNEELELAKVSALLDELKTGTLNEHDYNTTTWGASREECDRITKELCSKLQQLSDREIKNYSLEMQLWWRDHQRADKKRLQDELDAITKQKDKEVALKKLTSYERKLLGV